MGTSSGPKSWSQRPPPAGSAYSSAPSEVTTITSSTANASSSGTRISTRMGSPPKGSIQSPSPPIRSPLAYSSSATGSSGPELA